MNRTLANILLVIVLLGLVGATVYVFWKSQEELRLNQMLAERLIEEAKNSPAPALQDKTYKPATTTNQTTLSGGVVASKNKSTVIQGWFSYSLPVGGSFQYPTDTSLSQYGSEYWPDVTGAEGVVITVPDFSDLKYETLSRKQIFVGIDYGATDFNSCVAAEVSKTRRADDVVIHKVPITPDCAMEGCTIGNHYKIFQNNLCYVVTGFMLQANPGKIYDISDPLLAKADQENLVAKKRVLDIAEKIASTLTWTK